MLSGKWRGRNLLSGMEFVIRYRHSWLNTALGRVRAPPRWNLSVLMLLNDCHFSNAGLGICAQLGCFTRTRLSYSLNSPTTQGNYSLIRFGLWSFLVGMETAEMDWVLQLECARLWKSGHSSHGAYDLVCLIWF